MSAGRSRRQVHRVRNCHHLLDRDDRPFGIEARFVRLAQGDHPLADSEFVDTGADGEDGSGTFDAEHQRRLAGPVIFPGAHQDVGAVDTGHLESDQHLPGSRLRVGQSASCSCSGPPNSLI